MQTFLPLADFRETAKVLDNKRLGKQRVEAYQIPRVLAGLTKGWRNHPAVKMWEGYEPALFEYGREICREWIERGFNDSLYEKFPTARLILPDWLGDMRIHTSHQANLVRKDPDHYRRYFPEVDETMPYFWITKER
jgi:hypothetical protein